MDKQKRNAINDCILGVKKRDEESLIRLYDLVAHSIRYIALKYLKKEEDAEDLEQDFWANIYEIADKFTYLKNGFSYLCKVMTRMAINRYHKLFGERNRVTEFVDYNNIHSFDENTTLSNMIIRVSVQNAFGKLEPLEKIIMQLTTFEDKTILQISKELKMSKSRVGKIKLQAQEKIKQIIFNNSVEKSEC